MRHMTKFLISSLVILLTLSTAGAVSAASVVPTPASLIVTQSQIFNISIDGSEFLTTFGGDVLVEWDSTLLSLLSTDFTDAAADWDFANAPTSGSGFISVSVANLFSPNTGAFAIADIEFQASSVNTGDSFFTLTPSGWTDSVGDPLPIQPSVFNGTITVNAVPIPPTVLLLGAGLVGLVGIRRRVRS